MRSSVCKASIWRSPSESAKMDAESGSQNEGVAAKRMSLSPLAEASNRILAQAAFLSTLVGVDAAEVATCAAVMALSDIGEWIRQEPKDTSNSNTKSNMIEDAALVEAKSHLEKEGVQLEKAISRIATQIVKTEKRDKQMKMSGRTTKLPVSQKVPRRRRRTTHPK